MRISIHIISSLILSAITYPVFGWKALLIFIGGALIDADHYLWYAYKYNKFNLVECNRFFTIEAEKNNWKDVNGLLMIFHTVEFLLAMVFLSFFNELAVFFTIGLLLHYALDLLFILSVPKRFIANHSVIWWILKNNFRKV